MVKTLPTNENLLLLADILHNYLPNRRFGTIAVGAIGYSALNVELVVGVHGAYSYDAKLVKPENVIPDELRTSELIKMYNITVAREPFHAEMSMLLAAKSKNYKIFGMAVSRKISNMFKDSIKIHANLFDKDCEPVDSWMVNGHVLRQTERTEITNINWQGFSFAKAIKYN